MEGRRRVDGRLKWIRLASTLAGLLLAGPALAAQLTLTWTDNATNESGSAIERRSNPLGTYAEIATVGVNVTMYVDTTVTAGQVLTIVFGPTTPPATPGTATRPAAQPRRAAAQSRRAVDTPGGRRHTRGGRGHPRRAAAHLRAGGGHPRRAAAYRGGGGRSRGVQRHADELRE